MRSAGVVDAGALGFVHLLEGIGGYIEFGSKVLGDEIPAGLVIAGGGGDTGRDSADAGNHRYSVECMINAVNVDRVRLKPELLKLLLSHQVINGPCEQVRLHAHVDDVDDFFRVAARFGTLSGARIEDTEMSVQPLGNQRAPVAIVTDSGGAYRLMSWRA